MMRTLAHPSPLKFQESLGTREKIQIGASWADVTVGFVAMQAHISLPRVVDGAVDGVRSDPAGWCRRPCSSSQQKPESCSGRAGDVLTMVCFLAAAQQG
jgi:hypothetical protein